MVAITTVIKPDKTGTKECLESITSAKA